MAADRPQFYQDRSPNEENRELSVETGVILEPHGMCGGVISAVKFAKDLLRKVNGREKVYTFNEVVHNHAINKSLEDMGLVVIPQRTTEGEWPYDLIPDGSLYLLPAHGHTLADIEMAKKKGLEYFRAACVLVENGWDEAITEVEDGKIVILIGKKNHPEPRGTLGHVRKDSIVFVSSVQDLIDYTSSSMFDPGREYVLANQTTISLRDIQQVRQTAAQLVPKLDMNDKRGGCYATDNRQKAAEHFLTAEGGDAIIVVGSGDISNNTYNLAKVAWDLGKQGWLVNNAQEIDWRWISKGSGIGKLGLSSGASAPEEDLLGVADALISRGVQIDYQEPIVHERKTAFPIRDYDRFAILDQRYENWPVPQE